MRNNTNKKLLNSVELCEYFTVEKTMPPATEHYVVRIQRE